jgi:acetyltransferase-like isoleucine patch superfamily enzyme
MRALIWILCIALPWVVRRRLLHALLGYDLHPTSRVGFAVLLPKRLVMGPNSSVGALTVCRGVDLLELQESASIGRLNWITGYPSGDNQFFGSAVGRQPRLVLREHAAITHRHLLDCTAAVTIGPYTTIAGYHSQILTHSIDLSQSRQDARPIAIGSFCFVGTNCVILGGSSLPDYCVLGAASLLNRHFAKSHCLYAGVPARSVKELSPELRYFSRTQGPVH